MDVQPDRMVIEDRERGVFMINRRVYTEPEILEQEKRNIFNFCWLYAGHESEFRKNGDFVTRRIGGRPLILVRGNDGKIRAFLNSCRHRANIVCREECGNAQGFRCFYHAWVYSNTGDLIALPDSESYSEAFDRAEMGLRTVRMESYRGLMFVNFDNKAMSLEDYLAGAKEYIDLFCDYSDAGLEVDNGSYNFTMKANWKMLFENSGDVYHAPLTHRRYFNEFLEDLGFGVRNGGMSYRTEAPTLSLGNGHSVVLTIGSGNTVQKTARPEFQQKLENLTNRFGADRGRRVFNGVGMLTIFPNTFYVDAHKSLRIYYPTGTGSMEVVEWAMMPSEDSPELRSKRLESHRSFLGPGGFATPDDIEAMESCQRAFESEAAEWCIVSRGMKKEQPSVSEEAHIRTFYRRWLDMLGPQAEAVRYRMMDCYGDHDER